MKKPGWEIMLDEALAKAKLQSFEWGSHDCACWAFGVVSLIGYHPNYSDQWKGKYKSATGSVKMLRKLGWSSLFDCGQALLGPPRASPRLAQRGDLVLDASGQAFGICLGQYSGFLAPVGLTYRPTDTCNSAWRV